MPVEAAVVRLERDVEKLDRQLEEARSTAQRALTEIEVHKDSCVETGRRTHEKIDGVDRKLDAVSVDLIHRRTEEDRRQQERFSFVTTEINELKTGNVRVMSSINRIMLSIVGATITILVAVVIGMLKR